MATAGPGAKGWVVVCTSTESGTELSMTAAAVFDCELSDEVIWTGSVRAGGDGCCEDASCEVVIEWVKWATAVIDEDDILASAISIVW